MESNTFLYMAHRLNFIHIVSWRYSILLPTYGLHKVSLKFYQREVTQKLRKGEQSFLYAIYHLNLIHIAIKFHRYSIWLPSYGTHKDSTDVKYKSKGSNSETKKRRAATCCLDLIHTAMKFHQNIPYSYLIMACTRIVYEKKTYQKAVTPKLRKGEQPFLYVTSS